MNVPIETPTGWVFPKCGAVYAPSVAECHRCAPGQIDLTRVVPSTSTGTITIKPMPEPPYTVMCGGGDATSEFSDERWKQ